METLKSVFIIILIVVFIVGLFVAYFVSLYPQDLLAVKLAIKRGKDIDDFDVTGRKHEDKIKKLLEKNNYTYQRIDLKPEERTVYGVGKAEYANGTKQYFLYFSENWFTTIDEDQYKQLKDTVGQTITVCDYEMKWRKTNAR